MCQRNIKGVGQTGIQVLDQRDHRITKKKWNKDLTHVLGSQKGSKRKDLQIGILPLWESALKWGLGGVEPGSSHSGEIVFTCAPAADSALTSGGQSEVQAVIQQFPYSFLLFWGGWQWLWALPSPGWWQQQLLWYLQRVATKPPGLESQCVNHTSGQ